MTVRTLPTPTGQLPPTTVTAIVATRDRPRLLRRALGSIRAQRGSFGLDVIVVFDQSEPDGQLVDEFADLRLNVIANTRSPGLAGARNTGIAAARGEWIAFCDDDDWWDTTRIAAQLELVDGRPKVDFVVTGICIERGSTSIQRTLSKREITMSDFLTDRVMEAHPSTFLVRSEAIGDYIGLVDEDLPGSYAEDYDWLLRASRHVAVANVPEALVHVEWHDKSFFGNRWSMIDEALAAVVAKTPEFESDPAGLARILGQRAFANAAMGRRHEAANLMREAARLSWREPRLITTVAVLSGMVTGDQLSRGLNAIGRGF